MEYSLTSEKKYKKTSQFKEVAGQLLKNKAAVAGLVFLILLILVSLSADLLFDYNTQVIEQNISERLQWPSFEHPFGTDEYGRDYFTRTLYGGRVSLLVGFMSMIMTVVIGTSLGVFSGYVGGKVDMFLMSFTDIFLALPSMLLMVILNTFLKPGLPTLIVVLSLFSWASVARITRAETMSLKERDFVVATQNLGASNFRVIVKHIIPNILGPVIVAASLSVANAILMESSLSFLGLGVQIPRASWGSMLQGAQAHILDYPLLAVYPGVMILITVLSFNLLGDILRNALEPKIVE